MTTTDSLAVSAPGGYSPINHPEGQVLP